MTARPPLSPDEPFSEEERELALRLSRLDATAGPSAALDARILAAARKAAAAPARRRRRWPGAVGAAAVLVAAVGLAWQLRPMFQLPPPSVAQGESSGANRETVVQIENVRRPPAPVAEVGDQAAAAPAAAPASTTSTPGGNVAQRVAVKPAPAPRTRAPEFVDEALPAADAAAAAPAPAAVAAAPAQDSVRIAAEPQRKAAEAASRSAPPADIEADTRLAPRSWLARIRARRDAGDIDGARASLARFVAVHRNTRVPADLRPLLRNDDDPWSP